MRLTRSPAEIRGSFLFRLGVQPSPKLSYDPIRRSPYDNPAMRGIKVTTGKSSKKGVKGGRGGAGRGRGKDRVEIDGFRQLERHHSLSPGGRK